MNIKTFRVRHGKSFIAGLGGFALGAILLAACSAGSPQLDDLQNSPSIYPNYSSTLLNASGFPNVAILCFQGAGFATTTREAAGALTLVPEWDQFCKAQEGKQATQHGQP